MATEDYYYIVKRGSKKRVMLVRIEERRTNLFQSDIRILYIYRERKRERAEK